MFVIAPDVSITEFDAAPAGRFLLCTPRGRFMVTRSTVDLIRSLDGRESLGDLPCTSDQAAELARFLEDHVIPTGVFASADESGRPATKELGRPQSAYVYAVQKLIDAATLQRATDVFKHLFRPSVAKLLLAASVAAQAWFWYRNWNLRLEHISVEDYTLGALLFLLTLPFHELGHGSASRHYGCPHGAMGFAMYLVFPCFFTDVSEAWRLPRWSRVVIDLGGIYFQVLSAGMFAAMALASGAHAWAAAIIMVNWSVIHSLKPYLRGDGYWVLVDAVGIPSPYQRAKEYFAYLADRARGVDRDLPVLLQIAPRLRRLTVGYVAVTAALAAWVVAVLVWKTVTVVLPVYPSVLAQFARLPLGSLAWWRNAVVGSGQTVVILSLALALWSWSRVGARWLRREA
jgi:putative peptide zinc metalloprotease protein